MIPILSVFAAAFSAVLPIFFVKMYLSSKNISWIIAAVPFCLFLIYFYFDILKRTKHIGSSYAWIKVVAVLLALLISVMFFDEKINIKNGLGIVFALVAIYLFSTSEVGEEQPESTQ
jgi:multidrug transporter EmrE-like cation transporter